MIRILFLFLAAGAIASARAAQLPPDILTQLNGYNEVWTSPSTNGSPGSMPIGNGDLTANVWVENGGDLMLYLGKSDTWSEGTRLLKLGRTRIHFAPSPFAAGQPFVQTLNLYTGEIDITAGSQATAVSIKIWIDANQPVVRIEADGPQPFVVTCSNEVWRSAPYTLPSSSDPAADSFRGLLGGSVMPSESADVVPIFSDRIGWYHRNGSSWLATILSGENMSGLAYPDPWLNLTFGGEIKGAGFSRLNDRALQSAAATHAALSIYACTVQTSTAADWQNRMDATVAAVDAVDLETARTKHRAWWDAFWNRSWIFITGDANATLVTRGYLLQRFMEACQGRGAYPMKFNGGTFTFDYNGQNGDFRKWGPAYWHQNTRHLYWPLLAAGDFDLMQPFFSCTTNLLKIQSDATARYYGHGGAFFPETFNVCGLYTLENWGWNRTNATSASSGYMKYHYQGGLETLAMMLDYYDYTRDDGFAANELVPLATAVIRFFDQHWPRVGGQIRFYPANAIEMYWSCTNSTDYISGLRADLPRLLALPASLVPASLRSEWTNCLAAVPPLPMDPAGTFVRPAQTYGSSHNSENPECYCIFPYRLYDTGQSNLDVGVATFSNRKIKTNKNCWSQDVIEEALLGLTADAQTDVIGNFSQKDSTCRFPAFWKSHHDYLPDLDNGGAAMTALQFMLLQCRGHQIRVLPAWPANWDVDCKLCAPDNTSVRFNFQGGHITHLNTAPAARRTDVVSGYAVPSADAPVINHVGLDPGGLMIAGTSALAGSACRLLASPDLSRPGSNWEVVASSYFDASGSFSFTNPVGPDEQMFYRLQVP
jgi:alpha-L-fucosidase 2